LLYGAKFAPRFKSWENLKPDDIQATPA